MPLREIAALGFDRLKVRDVVLFSDTLAAPKALAMVGGNFTGGGGLPDPDEPPPQAAFQSKLKAMPRVRDTERTFIWNIGAVILSSLLW
jgi:hypothetical protein